LSPSHTCWGHMPEKRSKTMPRMQAGKVAKVMLFLTEDFHKTTKQQKARRAFLLGGESKRFLRAIVRQTKRSPTKSMVLW